MLSTIFRRKYVTNYFDGDNGNNAQVHFDNGSLCKLFDIQKGAEVRVQVELFKSANAKSYTFKVGKGGCHSHLVLGKDKTRLLLSVPLRTWFGEQSVKGYTHFCLWILPD